MSEKQLTLCNICKGEFHFGLDKSSKYTVKKNGKEILVCLNVGRIGRRELDGCK